MAFSIALTNTRLQRDRTVEFFLAFLTTSKACRAVVSLTLLKGYGLLRGKCVVGSRTSRSILRDYSRKGA